MDRRGRIIDVILPVTELDRANQIFERMLYQEPSRHPEQQGPKQAEKAAPTLQKQPVQEKEQEKQADAQSRQEGPVAQQAQRPKKGSRSERDSHATKTSSSTPRESGSTGKTPERPSVLERLKVYRTQLDQKSAPTRQKTKDRQKTR